MEYTKPLAKLIEEFQKLPGIGPKSAQRLALYTLKLPESQVQQFSDTLIQAKKLVKSCSTCFNLSAQEVCEICLNSHRDQSILCVVAESSDLIAIEKTREYKGLYHVLQGVISPLDGIGPETLKIRELLHRMSTCPVTEIIIAITPSVEGEATTLYLTKLIKPLGIKLSCLAYGIPMGLELEYADEATLARAIQGRYELTD